MSVSEMNGKKILTPPINQPTNQPTNLRQSLRLRPPKTKSPPAGHPLFYYTDCQQRPPGHLPESASAAASAPCTRPQIFNQRPDRFTADQLLRSTKYTRTRRTRWWPFRLNIRRRKHCYCCCRHSTSVLLISIHPHPHLSINHIHPETKCGGGGEQKN